MKISKIKVLLACYDVHPKKGGESSVAWNFLISLAEKYDLTVITRKNNIFDCEKYLEDDMHKNVKFIPHDVSDIALYVKRLFPSLIYLYCVLWQASLPKKFSYLLNTFDIVHSVNFVSDTIPSYMYKFNAFSIWGPVSHHEPIPRQIISFKSFLFDRFKLLVRYFLWTLFDIKRILNRFDMVLYSNNSVLHRFKCIDNPTKFSSTGYSSTEKQSYFMDMKPSDEVNILYVARMVPIKGWKVIIDNINFLSMQNIDKRINYHLVGDGIEFQKIQSFVQHKEGNPNIKIILHGNIDRTELTGLYKLSDIYACPSFEGGGIALAEAMSFALPIICFDNYGPGETVGDYIGKVKISSDAKMPFKHFNNMVLKMITDEKFRIQSSNRSLEIFNKDLSWEIKKEKLLDIYNEVEKRL